LDILQKNPKFEKTFPEKNSVVSPQLLKPLIFSEENKAKEKRKSLEKLEKPDKLSKLLPPQNSTKENQPEFTKTYTKNEEIEATYEKISSKPSSSQDKKPKIE
jgi:hypothetical protein